MMVGSFCGVSCTVVVVAYSNCFFTRRTTLEKRKGKIESEFSIVFATIFFRRLTEKMNERTKRAKKSITGGK